MITKIDIVRAFKYGGSKMKSIAIPEVFSRDNKINIGDELEIFRGDIDGKDALIIVPTNSNGKLLTADIVNDNTNTSR